MATEESEIYHRLGRLEQELHTLKFRSDSLDAHNLPIRVANLEPVVKSISSDVAKIEACTEKLESAVTSMKSWSIGFAAAVTAVGVFIGLLPVLKGMGVL